MNSFDNNNNHYYIIGKTDDNKIRLTVSFNKVADLIGYLIGNFAIQFFYNFLFIIDLINKKSYGFSIIIWLTNILIYTLS